MHKFSTNNFDLINGTFIAEAGDLQVPPGVSLKQFQLELDSGTVCFSLVGIKRDREGDVQSWRYQTADLLTAEIFND